MVNTLNIEPERFTLGISSSSTKGSSIVPGLVSSAWDLATQTPHGGQDWRHLHNFVEDFSVTTNSIGCPPKALEAAHDSLASIIHYPAANAEPALSNLAIFLSESRDGSTVENLRSRLLLGNGASELIDLAIKNAAPGQYWRPGPYPAQYMEYERCASYCGREKTKHDVETANLMCLVNPCNPTGDFMDIKGLINYIESSFSLNNRDGSRGNRPESTVIVDESMLAWIGPEWRYQSLVSQGEWIYKMAHAPWNVNILIIHSWTKLFACPGLRIGSLLCPSAEYAAKLQKVKVPWSISTPAIAFIDAAVREPEFLKKTWLLTPTWRKTMLQQIAEKHPSWIMYGTNFLSYVWIDTKSDKIAKQCVQKCYEAGVPIRSGADGYNKPTFIRIAVRPPEPTAILVQALNLVEDEVPDPRI